MKEIVKLNIVALLILIACLNLYGEKNDSSRRIINSLGIDIRPSYAFPSYKDDIMKDKLNMTDVHDTKFATSFHLKYSFTFGPNTSAGRFYPGVWQGIGASVNYLGSPKAIGTPVSVYVFQGAPIWRLNERLSLYYEWNFGASFGWRKSNGDTYASNLIVGSNTNAYINLGTGLLWRFNGDYSMTVGADLTHFSNGNTSFPNPGVNMAGIRVGFIRAVGAKLTDIPKSDADDQEMSGRHKLQFDLTAYCALRKRVYRGGETPVLLNGHYGVVGLDIAPMWRVSKIFRAGISADLQWDESTDLKRHYVSGSTSDDICFYRPPILNQICAGISGRAELVMPIFSVNLGIGYNIIGPEETKASYQLANLKVRFTERLFLNIGYQLLNFQKQNNLMLGFGYSFR